MAGQNAFDDIFSFLGVPERGGTVMPQNVVHCIPFLASHFDRLTPELSSSTVKKVSFCTL